MLKNLINDISEDRFIVMDTEMSTTDPRILDQYASASGEQEIRVRVRINEKKYRAIADDALKAMEIAVTRHECKRNYDGKKQLEFENKKGNFFQFSCLCGGKVEISDFEIAAL